jgi:hypothetical protein
MLREHLLVKDLILALYRLHRWPPPFHLMEVMPR